MRLAASLIAACLALAGSPTAVTADAPQTAPSGATFTLPTAWSVKAGPAVMVLSPPEGDTRVAIVDVAGVVDARAAADAAWALYRPQAHRTFKLMTAGPPRDGWDERQLIEYETSPNEKAFVQARALRSGARWTVAIIEGSEATVEKRGAALSLLAQSLRPAGYARETFAGRTPHALDGARIEAMLSFVQTSMNELDVPGVGIALIDHGRIVYEGGLGVRELGRPEPVDAHTLFMIASNTKGMTTLLLSRLADEGRLSWEEPVTQVYPAFRLGSDETTRKVLIKHLVCACTGLPRKDYEWIFDTSLTTPASTTFVHLAATEPTSGFGEAFQYNNLMASAAGYIGGHLVHPDEELGAAYDWAMQEMIFDPLGMRETTFDYARALRADHASPHGYDVDGHQAVADMAFNYAGIPSRPAGGAWSSAHDVALYVGDELSLGRLPNGRRLVSEQNLLARRIHGVPVGEDAWYGMGLETDRHWGVEVVHHGGSMAGFKTDWVAVPDAQIGAVVLTNADDGAMMLRPFMRRLLEVVYDGKPEAAGDVAAAATRYKAAVAKARERLVVPAAPRLAGALAPAYANPDLGHITVTRAAGETWFDFGLWKSRVASRTNVDGTVSFITIDPTNDGFEYVVGTRGGKRALVVRDGQHEYVYLEA